MKEEWFRVVEVKSIKWEQIEQSDERWKGLQLYTKPGVNTIIIIIKFRSYTA